MMIIGGHVEEWGLIPSFLDEEDERDAKEQINAHYIGGWNKFEGFKMDPKTFTLTYPDDPPMHPLSMLTFRNEVLLIYPHAWVVVMQKGGTWEIARLD